MLNTKNINLGGRKCGRYGDLVEISTLDRGVQQKWAS